MVLATWERVLVGAIAFSFVSRIHMLTLTWQMVLTMAAVAGYYGFAYMATKEEHEALKIRVARLERLRMARVMPHGVDGGRREE